MKCIHALAKWGEWRWNGWGEGEALVVRWQTSKLPCFATVSSIICSMHPVWFQFGRLLYITYLQYAPGMVYIWKTAVHYISAVCTQYGLCLEGCFTLHICSMYPVWFTFGRLLCITYVQHVPGMVYVWKAAVHYISAICTRYGLLFEGCCTLHICSMYRVWFMFERLLYITYLQYVLGMVYVWKAAVHYISAVYTRYGLRLDGCCTLHICSMYQVWFMFGRLLYITLSTQWHTLDFTYFSTVIY